MATYEIASEAHSGMTITVVRLAGQADTATIGLLLDELAARSAREPAMRILFDETALRPCLLLPHDIGALVDKWRATLARRPVRLARC